MIFIIAVVYSLLHFDKTSCIYMSTETKLHFQWLPMRKETSVQKLIKWLGRNYFHALKNSNSRKNEAYSIFQYIWLISTISDERNMLIHPLVTRPFLSIILGYFGIHGFKLFTPWLVIVWAFFVSRCHAMIGIIILYQIMSSI